MRRSIRRSDHLRGLRNSLLRDHGRRQEAPRNTRGPQQQTILLSQWTSMEAHDPVLHLVTTLGLPKDRYLQHLCSPVEGLPHLMSNATLLK